MVQAGGLAQWAALKMLRAYISVVIAFVTCCSHAEGGDCRHRRFRSGVGVFGDQEWCHVARGWRCTSSYSIALSSRKVQRGHYEVFPGLGETPVCCLEETLSQVDLKLVSTLLPAGADTRVQHVLCRT
jgi:hypothetical protein